MIGPFVHRIDPVLAEVGGVYLWWYGLSYSLGFLGTHLWMRRVRQRIGLTLAEVYDLSLLFALGVLFGGRAVEVVFYEWPYYAQHPSHIGAVWLGGMSTHGVLLGGIVSLGLFCWLAGRPFLSLADELVIPGAFYMATGRIGNFIDGQILGSVTSVWWAVQFPDAPGFRHPVVLYDSLKNFLLIPLLLYVRKRQSAPGVVLAQFIFWYGFLRIPVDIFREYPTRLLGLATGQSFNIFMSLLGVGLLVWFRRRPVPSAPPAPRRSSAVTGPVGAWSRRIVFAALLLFPLIIPSDWTQDVPARYAKRHPGMRHSRLYPPLR
jgi:phosphatidylglycerol:prolipoprotein diacylglycerol transferase